MNETESARGLITKYFWAMPDDAPLSTGKKSVLPEGANDFIEKYSSSLNVDMTRFDFSKYFPNEGARFLPNAILPKFMRSDNNKPELFTVQMLIESAKAGRWLY